ncbi:hypothetical protein BGZ74_011907, partial [Mortierella antarctica]
EYPADSTFSSHESDWSAEFDLKEGTLRWLQVYDLAALDKDHMASEALESLRVLIVDVDDVNIDQDIACMVQASPMLQELNISLRESGALERVEKTLEIWHGRNGPFQLTLLERDIEGRGRLVCQVVVRGDLDRNLEGSSAHHQGSNALAESSQERRQGVLANIEFWQWNSDHVSVPLADRTAVLLDMATEFNPWVLTSFVLDISNLSQESLT